jgi:hypothetical protein
MGREALPALLEIAIERKYLDVAEAGRIAAEARRSGKPVEAVLIDRGALSTRRVERLQLHLRYKSLRRVDKAYGKVAVKGGLVAAKDLEAALELQRRRFEEQRDCLRLGAILVKQGLITLDQDKQVRTRVAKLSASSASGSASGAATLLDDSASQGAGRPVPAPSYERIDEAVGRVEAMRRLQEDLSESCQAEDDTGDVPPPRDSAAEFENACVLLARRRVQGGARPVSKSTGALRITA